MERRTKEQCYQRYVYSLKDSIRHGPFTDAEDMLLIIGKELYGKDWAKISEMLPCRYVMSNCVLTFSLLKRLLTESRLYVVAVSQRQKGITF